MVTGVLDICPNLKSKVFQYIGNGQISTALPRGPSPHLGPPFMEEDGGGRAQRQWRGRHA